VILKAIDFGGLEQVPTHALTIGTGTICQAAEIILLATGDAKARSVRDSLQGPITHLVSVPLESQKG
jgi:glucosamine-6-phosphate deaminase